MRGRFAHFSDEAGRTQPTGDISLEQATQPCRAWGGCPGPGDPSRSSKEGSGLEGAGEGAVSRLKFRESGRSDHQWGTGHANPAEPSEDLALTAGAGASGGEQNRAET